MRGLLLLLGLRLLAADLIQVQVISRAGAHKWHFPSKQWRQESAALLPAGFVGMEELGQVLKARYIGLAASMPLANVSDIYQFGDALIRTMAREQTVQSADAITYGVWSPVGRAVRGAPLTGGHQAVPVFTISPAMDYLLSAYRACPMVDFVVDTFMNGSDYQKKENATLGIRTQLGTLLNMSSELIMMPQLYDRVVLATLYGDMPSAGEYVFPSFPSLLSLPCSCVCHGSGRGTGACPALPPCLLKRWRVVESSSSSLQPLPLLGCSGFCPRFPPSRWSPWRTWPISSSTASSAPPRLASCAEAPYSPRSSDAWRP
ncbi:hypothetical protein Naga_100274g1 [Nannochloropsis gaditana]|uniref:Uncharacterized protein n=1 Tax=Nannochloropsis gaditana TaxID=72520 RepID=W7TLN1_9STRA|nr:hypothetical protein Naga_100274g1 [Nannochloropsis gaditana]